MSLMKNQNPVQRFLRLRNTESTKTYSSKRIDVKGHTISTKLNTYKLDWVFRRGDSTAQVNEQLRVALELAKEGRHAMIFAHGDKRAGKTTTLFGDPSSDAPALASEDPSFLQYIMQDLFPNGEDSHWTIDLTWVQSETYRMFSLLHDGDTYDREIEHRRPARRAEHTPTSGPIYWYSRDNDCFFFVDGDVPKKHLVPCSVSSAASLQYYARRAKQACHGVEGPVVCEMRLFYKKRPRGIVTLTEITSDGDHFDIARAIEYSACEGRSSATPNDPGMERWNRHVSHSISSHTDIYIC